MYYLVAKSVKEGLGDEFSSWTMADYWRRQLPDILIARLSSSFRRSINPRAFHGEMEFRFLSRKAPAGGKPFLMAVTSHRYWDDDGGLCDGEVTLAITNVADIRA